MAIAYTYLVVDSASAVLIAIIQNTAAASRDQKATALPL